MLLVLRDWYAYLLEAFFTLKCLTVARYACKCHSTYAHKNSTSSAAHIFMKIASAQQHYVQISYTEFHTNGTINVESADRI